MAISLNRPSLLSRIWFPLALALLLLVALPGLILVIMHVTGEDKALNDWLGEQYQLSYGFPLPTWFAFVLLLIPPLIVLLYFLKLKRKPLQVPSTFLWKKSIEDLHVNSLFQWLRENVLLLLQVLVVLCFLYALMGFRFHGATTQGRHYILMIDNSASMSATDVAPSRLEWAKQEAIKVIDAQTDDSVGMVIVFNSKANTLQSYTNNKAKLREAVLSIEQSQRTTRIEDALVLADSLANQFRSTEDVASQPDEVVAGKQRTFVQARGVKTDLFLFSDGDFPDPSEAAIANLNSLLSGGTSSLGNLTVHFQQAGNAGWENVDNVGIVTLNANRMQEPKGTRRAEDALNLNVLVQVRNYRAEPVEKLKLCLDVIVDGKVLPLPQKVLTIPARMVDRDEKLTPEQYKDEPGEVTATFTVRSLDLRANTVLHAYLKDHKDDFAMDDQAWLVVGLTRKAKVLIVGPANPVLDAFFDQEATRKVATMQRMKVEDLDTDAYRQAARGGEFDLVIFDRCIPEKLEDMPQANTFCIDRPPPPWQRGSEPLKNPVLIVGKAGKDHPLLRHLAALWDVGVSDGFVFDLRANLSEAGRQRFNVDGKQTDRLPLPTYTTLIETSRAKPVLFALARGPYTDLVQAFPLLNDKGDLVTNWPLQPTFPLFLRNVLYHLGNVNEAVREESVQPGEPMHLRPEAGVNRLKVTPPSGMAKQLERGGRAEFIFDDTEKLGIYAVEHDDGAQRSFAVNLLDPQESNIEPRNRFKVGADVVDAGANQQQPRELWKWLLLAALGFLLLEWYIYNRRVFV